MTIIGHFFPSLHPLSFSELSSIHLSSSQWRSWAQWCTHSHKRLLYSHKAVVPIWVYREGSVRGSKDEWFEFFWPAARPISVCVYTLQRLQQQWPGSLYMTSTTFLKATAREEGLCVCMLDKAAGHCPFPAAFYHLRTWPFSSHI